MEALEEGDVCAELPCGHVFHRECVTEWLALRPSCPICREDTGEALERAGENENEGEGAMVTVPLGGPHEGETRDREEREEREEPGWMDNPLYRLRRVWRAQNGRVEEYDRRRTEGTASAGTGTAEGGDPPRSSPEEPTPDPPRRQRRQRRLRFGLCSIECT